MGINNGIKETIKMRKLPKYTVYWIEAEIKTKFPKPIPVKITNKEGVVVVSKKHIRAQQQRRLREKYI